MPAKRSPTRTPAARKPPARKAAKTAAKGTSKKAATKQPATKKPATKKVAAKKAARKAPATQGGARADKGEGPAAVQAAIRKLPAEHRAMAERFDAIVARVAPDARRAVKWGSPMWGIEGRGWFAAFGSFKRHAKINFFSGARLDPAPPEGEGKDMRSVNLAAPSDFDEARITSWVRQAAAIPGWGR